MSLPIDKPCIFCGGKYLELRLGKGYESHNASTLLIGKTGSTGVVMAKVVIFKCSTCGNMQSFLEDEPHI